MTRYGPDSGGSGARAAPDVRIAEYLYRHEAEFAAGFLRDAGIPYRLQIDDAGGADAGVTIGRPAVLWVRAEDEEEARALLALEGTAAEVRPSRAGEGTSRPAGPPDRPPGTVEGHAFVPLCRGERIVAGLLALVLFGLASAGGEGAVPWVGVWEAAALLLALALGLSAVSGQTIGVLKAILRTLSGMFP